MLKHIEHHGTHGEASPMNDGASSTNNRITRNMRVDNLGHKSFQNVLKP